MQNGNERPGSNWGLPSSSSLDLAHWFSAFIVGSLLAFGLHRWLFSGRPRSQVPAQSPQHAQAVVSDYVVRYNSRRVVSRWVSGQNPENLQPSFFRVETTIDSNQGLAPVEQTLESSDLLAETRIEVGPEGFGQTSSETHSQEINHFELTIVDDSIIEQAKETLSRDSEVQKTVVSSINSTSRKGRVELMRLSYEDYIVARDAGLITEMVYYGP